MPIHTLGVGGCLQLCRHLPSAWISIPAPSSLFFFLPTHPSSRSGGLRVGKGARELADSSQELGELKGELG